MDDQGRFHRAALESGIPDDEIRRFAGHLRLSIRLGGTGVAAGSPQSRGGAVGQFGVSPQSRGGAVGQFGVSPQSGGGAVGQFGGAPRLPVGVDWPSADGSPLPFVFSVDCAALPRVDGFALPAGGSLLFFLDHEKDHLAAPAGEHGYARVVHVPAGAETVPSSGAAVVGEQYAVAATVLAELPDWLGTNEAEDEEEEDDLSPFQEQLARDLERDLPHRAELSALAGSLWPPSEGLASGYLGGYADDDVITSIAEQTLAGREKAGEIVIPVANWYSHVEREKHRLMSEWVSLARFSLPDELYSGSFVIRHDDLAAGRLDRAFSVTRFSE
ncbi:DUF1963 domain-containing protein [Paractinoplanes atraurantiacus]|uniref:DUF1963 domain-containing protein n=1 Tax=Paractinoplanes atraurantiacus TaxID=1036182 RepID=A0A285K710_9ACTN|nr:DUF1963 domain-containing protein [Actinoplanes atraurantiacus]SNY68392.1 protein of unknown function [Actinoplanes atraurantiacus]